MARGCVNLRIAGDGRSEKASLPASGVSRIATGKRRASGERSIAADRGSSKRDVVVCSTDSRWRGSSSPSRWGDGSTDHAGPEVGDQVESAAAAICPVGSSRTVLAMIEQDVIRSPVCSDSGIRSCNGGGIPGRLLALG